MEIDPKCLTLSITATAIAIAEGKTDEQIALLSATFMQLADSLSVLLAAKALNEAQKAKCAQLAAENQAQIGAAQTAAAQTGTANAPADTPITPSKTQTPPPDNTRK